ncbi:MAG: cupin, partial [Acidobacteria bacterium]|nr:cupin [Acidobacteriota bacterium]
VALPLDEPTLHLTVGIHNRTGADLLQWLAGKLRAREAFRKDLPRFTSADERAQHLSELRQELLAEWDSSTLLEDYFDEQDAMAEPRPTLNLPLSATPNVLPSEDDAIIALSAPRPLKVKAENGVIEFACNKKLWRFAAAALPLLQALNERRAFSIQELCDLMKGKLDEQTVRAFLRELSLHGLVVIKR